MDPMKTMLIAVAALVSAPALAGPGVIIAPVSATIDVSGPGEGSIADTYNENGLLSHYTPGLTNFDAYIATNPMHSLSFLNNEWFGNSGTTTAQVTYDLGSVKAINALALWNEESSGIGRLDLTGSADGITFSAIGTYSPFDNPLADYPAQVFTFSATSVQFVRFGMSGCPQPDPAGFASCAIGEVAFRTVASGDGTVPEPAAWALMIAGFGLVGAVMRRRREDFAAA